MRSLKKGGIYAGDPICSRCYGFATAKKKLEEQCAGYAAITLLVGGFKRTGQSLRMLNVKYPSTANCARVENSPGNLPNLTSWNGMILSTTRGPLAEPLSFFANLQGAVYAENRDVTEDIVLIDFGRLGWPR